MTVLAFDLIDHGVLFTQHVCFAGWKKCIYSKGLSDFYYNGWNVPCGLPLCLFTNHLPFISDQRIVVCTAVIVHCATLPETTDDVTEIWNKKELGKKEKDGFGYMKTTQGFIFPNQCVFRSRAIKAVTAVSNWSKLKKNPKKQAVGYYFGLSVSAYW